MARAKSRSERARTDDGAGDVKTRDPERTKARILRAATELFTKLGPGGASLDDISREAGVNRGLIYHYFKTKDSLFDQVLARPLAEYLESHFEFLQRSPLDLDGLCEATAGFFRFLGRHHELVRLLSWTMAMRRIVHDVSALEVTRALFARLVRRLDEAKAAGSLRSDLDTQHLLITVIDLSVSWYLTREDWAGKFQWSPRDPRELDEARLAAILDLVSAVARPAAPAAVS